MSLRRHNIWKIKVRLASERKITKPVEGVLIVLYFSTLRNGYGPNVLYELRDEQRPTRPWLGAQSRSNYIVLGGCKVAAEEPVTAERRRSFRYPLVLDVKYRLQGQREYHVGSTINIASQGVLFRCDYLVRALINEEITVEISWPALLHGTCAMKLVVSGRVAWSGGGKCAVRVYAYEFRTMGKRTDSIVSTGTEQPAVVSIA